MSQQMEFDAWNRFHAECKRLGLGHVQAGSLEECGLPTAGNATHAIVVAQTGGDYWRHMQTIRKLDPALDKHEHPLDTFTKRTAARLRSLLGEACTDVFFPFEDGRPFNADRLSGASVDFLGVALKLGMGTPSRMVILIHPKYGLWFAFRMLFLVRDTKGILPKAKPVLGDPCRACPAPCISACPGGAVRGEVGKERLDYPASFRFRIQNEGVCTDACASRLACPVGAHYQYPPDFIAHSHHRAFAVGKRWVEAQNGKS